MEVSLKVGCIPWEAAVHTHDCSWKKTDIKMMIMMMQNLEAENLHNLERTEHMMVRWMCGVLSVRVQMTGCRLAELWRLWGKGRSKETWDG